MHPKQIVLLAAATAFLSLPVLWLRHRAERANSTIEIGLELPEVRILCRSQGTDMSAFLSKARDAGISALAIFEKTPSSIDPGDLIFDSLRRFERAARREGGFLTADILEANRGGFDLILRVSNGAAEHLSRILTPLGDTSQGPLISAVGDEMLGYPDSLPAVADLVRQGHFRLAMVEFSPQKGFERLAQLVPEPVIRTHSIEAIELRRLGPEQSKARWLRAVRERSVRLLYLHLLPEKTAAENLENIRDLSQSLEDAGFRLGVADGVRAPARGTLWRQALGFVIAILFPLLALHAAVRWPRLSPTSRFFLMSAVTGAGGLLIGALGYCLPFMNGVELFRGVKLELALPILLAPFILMDRRQIRDACEKPILRWEAATACLAAVAVGLLIIRSGNAGSDFMPGFEGRLRDILQQVFLVRPRFKEFLIGHPLMVAGLMQGDGTARGDRRTLWLMIPGLVGQTSLLNTFSHFHIPIEVSLFRVALGLGLGYGLGRLVNLALARLAQRPT